MDIQTFLTAQDGVLGKKHILITGHYGTGKTNIALNLALQIVRYEPVCLIDCDIVNPYFRSSDSKEMLEEKGIKVIVPNFAGTNLDAPSLPADIYSVFNRKGKVIWDVGGDDAGAVVLGRFASKLKEQGYSMLYVINRFRPLTENAESMEEYLRDIEKDSRLQVSAIINNSNLAYLTDDKTLKEGKECAEELARRVSLPILFSCISDKIPVPFSDQYFPLLILTQLPW